MPCCWLTSNTSPQFTPTTLLHYKRCFQPPVPFQPPTEPNQDGFIKKLSLKHLRSVVGPSTSLPASYWSAIIYPLHSAYRRRQVAPSFLCGKLDMQGSIALVTWISNYLGHSRRGFRRQLWTAYWAAQGPLRERSCLSSMLDFRYSSLSADVFWQLCHHDTSSVSGDMKLITEAQRSTAPLSGGDGITCSSMFVRRSRWWIFGEGSLRGVCGGDSCLKVLTDNEHHCPWQPDCHEYLRNCHLLGF